MEKPSEFNFGDQSVADAYDAVLVPILFDPWAAQLVDDFKQWQGQCVLDLATGTGVLAQRLAKHVGPTGKVIGADINGEMLTLARQRCAGANPPVEFIESPAEPLNLPGESVDVVVCQQGYQFFPDKPAAAREMFRVMRKHGTVIVSTWRPVEECEFFGSICDALHTVGEDELSDMMRIPFDSMPESELSLHFEAAGFDDVRVRQHQLALTVSEGVSHAVNVAYSTPIGPKLRALTENKQAQFRKAFKEQLDELSSDGQTMGRMVSNVLSAEKPS